MSTYASKPTTEPLPTAPGDRVTSRAAARPQATSEVDVRRAVEDVSRGLVHALVALPVGVVVAVLTAGSGSVAVLSGLVLAVVASALYRYGAHAVGRRGGFAAVVAVVVVGVLLEALGIAATDVVGLGGVSTAPGPLAAGLLERLSDVSELRRYGLAAAILLVVGLGCAAVSLVWLRVETGDEDPEA